VPDAERGRDAVWKSVWRRKLHLEPTALERSPATVRAAYDHGWVASDLLRDTLAPFPTGLLRWWSDLDAGHVVFTHGPSRYCSGISLWRDNAFAGICFLLLGDMLWKPDIALTTWLCMLDHLLGSRGRPSGERFSDGMGASPRLAEAAQRFARAFALGYGAEEFGRQDAQSYFVLALTLFCVEPKRLAIVDPLTERLLRQSLFAETFWQRE